MDDVVRLTVPEPGIALVEMRDIAGRNTFSDALCHGLLRTFAHIKTRADLRAVVLTGHGRTFCSGGTQQAVVDIARQKRTFEFLELYSVLLECPIPVVAAMQGHAIGGGLNLGCSADLRVFAEEAIYNAVFLRLGLTPGAGATLLIPRALGTNLAHEMMYRANGWRGSELLARGLSSPVVPAARVLETAMAMARDLADKTRTCLVELKAELTHGVRQQMPAVIERELAMHRRCASEATVSRIGERFGE